MTPCGAEPSPSGVCARPARRGSSQPSLPVACAVYQTPPSAGRDVVRVRPGRHRVLAEHDALGRGLPGRRAQRDEHRHEQQAPAHGGKATQPGPATWYGVVGSGGVENRALTA